MRRAAKTLGSGKTCSAVPLRQVDRLQLDCLESTIARSRDSHRMEPGATLDGGALDGPTLGGGRLDRRALGGETLDGPCSQSASRLPPRGVIDMPMDALCANPGARTNLKLRERSSSKLSEILRCKPQPLPRQMHRIVRCGGEPSLVPSSSFGSKSLSFELRRQAEAHRSPRSRLRTTGHPTRGTVRLPAGRHPEHGLRVTKRSMARGVGIRSSASALETLAWARGDQFPPNSSAPEHASGGAARFNDSTRRCESPARCDAPATTRHLEFDVVRWSWARRSALRVLWLLPGG